MSKIKGKEIPFFIFPKTQGPEILFDLISNHLAPKVYMSFPITGIPPSEEKEIEKFKSEIRKKYIAFDPYSIQDRKLILAYHTVEDEIKEELIDAIKEIKARRKKDAIWSTYIDELSPLSLTKFYFSDVEVEGKELYSVIETIDSQIVSRDYMLIDQADFIVMYIKDEEGIPRISAGCQSELIHAYTNGKPVYVIYQGGAKKLSPWVTQYSELFPDTKKCLDFILQKHLNKE